MEDKIKMLEGQLGKEKLGELAGLAAKCFIIKKEDFEKQPGQPYINEDGNLVTFIGEGENKMEWEHREKLMGEMWHEVPLVNSSITASVPSDSIAGQQKGKKKAPRSFNISFTLVDDKQERYEAQKLAATVLPVFSKSMLSITDPYIPFKMRNNFISLYRNSHNYYYAAMRNRYSHLFSEEKNKFGNYEIPDNDSSMPNLNDLLKWGKNVSESELLYLPGIPGLIIGK